MKEYDIKITEVLEKTVQVQAESREEAEAILPRTMRMSLFRPVKKGISARRS